MVCKSTSFRPTNLNRLSPVASFGRVLSPKNVTSLNGLFPIDGIIDLSTQTTQHGDTLPTMASSKRVVFDSDDDGDGLSPLSSPLSSPQLSPLPLPPIETRIATTTNPHDASTSTDPSFFRDVYEEQQRAIGAQLAPLHTALDDSHSQDDASGNTFDQSSRDPWEVPSSPIEVSGQLRGSYLKRKREEGEQQQQQVNRQNNVSVVVQLDDLNSGSASEPAKTKKQKRVAGPGHDQTQQNTSAGLEIISIPLEPLTPSRMHQYPRLLSSNINDDPAVMHDASLPRRLGLDLGLEAAASPARQSQYDDPLPPNEGATQSTIAFTTPSLYASSGRRALGSSNNNSNSILKQIKTSSSHDMDVVQEGVAVTAHNATPPRRVHKAADLAQVRFMSPSFEHHVVLLTALYIKIMSSPDIIAEPTTRDSPRRQSPLPQKDEEHEEDEEGGVEWEAHSTHGKKNTTESRRQQSRQRRSSVADELSISIDVPARSEVVQEIYKSDASYDSLKQKRISTAKNNSPTKKAIFIAASDDEDEDAIVVLPPAESESDFSAVPTKSKPASRGKRGPKKKVEVLSVELLPGPAPSKSNPKRPRGRPKRQKTPQQEVGSDEDVLAIDNDEAEVKIEPAESKSEDYTAAADSEADSEAELDPLTPVKAKGKKGKRGAKNKKDTKAGQGRKPTKADVAATAIPNQESVEEKTVLGKTSGNASAASSFQGEVHGVVSAKEEETPLPNNSKPVTTTAPERTVVLSTGLNTTASQGRVPYRVGLSKKFRIAPLLKMIRK